MLEGFYSVHVKVRYLHDKVYQNSKVYKHYSDSPVSNAIHKATLVSFVASMLIFLSLQYILPFTNPFQPGRALANSPTKTWSTNGDFHYNKVTNCTQTTHTNVSISGADYTGDNNCAAQDTDASVSLQTKGSVDYTTVSLPDNTWGSGTNSTTNKTYLGSYNTQNVYVLDNLTNTIAKTISLSGNTQLYFAVNEVTNKIYASSLNGATDKVTVIDGATDTVSTSIPVSSGGEIAVNSITKRVYQANQGNGSGTGITVIDGDNNSVITTIPLANTGVLGIATNTTTNKIYVANSATNTVSVIDGYNNTITNTINVDTGPRSVTVDSVNNKIYVTTGAGKVSVINGSNNSVSSIAVGTDPTNIAYNQNTGKVFVADSSGKTIWVIDGSTNNIISKVSDGASYRFLSLNTSKNLIYATNGGTMAVIDGTNNVVSNSLSIQSSMGASNPSTNSFYVPGPGNNITVLNATTNATLKTVGVGTTPYAIGVNTVRNKIYVLNAGSNNVSVINGADNTFIKNISVETMPVGITVDNVNNRIYVLNYNSNSISFIDGATDTVSATWSNAGRGSAGSMLAVNPTTNKLYYNVYSTNQVLVRNATTGAYISSINVGAGTRGLTLIQSLNKIFASNSGAGTVSVIDGNNDTVSATLPVGTTPWGMSNNSSNNMVYVANSGSNNVTVINGSTNTVAATVNVGTSPYWTATDSSTNKVYVPNASPNNNISVINKNPNYLTQGVITGFKIDAGLGTKANWASLKWNTVQNATLPANTDIKFRVATSDTNNGSDWAWSSYFTQTSGSSYTVSSLGVAPSEFLQIEMTLESSDGVNTPTVNDFQVLYESLESPSNGATTMYRSNGSTKLMNSAGSDVNAGNGGGYTSESSIKITTTGLICTDCVTSTNRKIQVQAALMSDTTFASPISSVDANTTSTTLDGGATYTSTATLTGLVSGNSYHIRLRQIDSQSRVSGWTVFASDGIAFIVDQISPNIASLAVVSPSGNGFVNSTNVTVRITAAGDADSKLAKLYLSNDGASNHWKDVTPPNFTGQASFTGDITNWDLNDAIYGGTAVDGAKTVYAKIADNAGNVHGSTIGNQSITIQPNASTGQDTFVSTAYPNSTFGTGDTIQLGMVHVSYEKQQGLIRFPLSSIPSGSNITGATFSIYQYTQVGTIGVPINIYKTTSSWDQSTVTWNTAPTQSASASATKNVVATNGYYDFSSDLLTSDVQGWVSNPATNNGWYIRIPSYENVQSPFYYAYMYTSNNPNANQEPKLVVTYSEEIKTTTTLDTTPPADFTLTTPLNNTWQGSSTPALSWNASSDNPGSGIAKYQLYIDGVLDRDNISNVATSTTPQTPLTETMHTWRIRAYDNAGGYKDSNTLNVGYDSSIPNTTLVIDPPKATGWYTTSPTITLTATSSGQSGINSTVYKWGTASDLTDSNFLNSGVSAYSSPFDMYTGIGDGDHYLYWRSTNNAGGVETIKHQQLKLDTGIPATGYAISPQQPNGNNGWYTSAPTITLTPSDPNGSNKSGVAQTYYQWNSESGSWLSGTSITTIPEGNNTLYYYTVDNAGNTEQHEHQIIKYDATGPAVSGLSILDQQQTTIALQWSSGIDPASGVDSYVLQRKLFTGSWEDVSVWTSDAIQSTTYTDVGVESGKVYSYRVKGLDRAGNFGGYSLEKKAATVDTVKPSDVESVNIAACNGTLETISVPGSNDTSPKCTNILNRGFEITLTWKASTDGVGISGYKIYRAATNSQTSSDWTLVGVLPFTGAEILTWHDNNDNNDATFGIGNYPLTDPSRAGQPAGKITASPHLNDYTSYYYKITSLDTSNNESNLILPPIPDVDQNMNHASTPDVTKPLAPTGVVATAMGLDGSNPDANVIANSGSGVVSSATTSTITDNTKSWIKNVFGGLTLKIASGRGSGQTVSIVSNTATTITISENWSTTPDATSKYEIYMGHQRMQVDWGASFDNKLGGIGTVSSASSSTLTDSSKSWSPNSYAGMSIRIVGGSGKGQSATIANNTKSTISIVGNWSQVPDTSSQYQILDPGSGVKEYKVYRDIDPDGDFAVLVATVTTLDSLTLNDDGLGDFTNYYYRITAGDNFVPQNVSVMSDYAGQRSASSAVPTTPSGVNVVTKKGNPNTDSDVGHTATITFNGSLAKNCLNNLNCLTKYEIYRSTTNFATASDWLNPAKADKLKLNLVSGNNYTASNNGSDVIPQKKDDDRDTTYTINDTNLTDATTYYYKIRAVDNTPNPVGGGACPQNLIGIQCQYSSSLSTVATGTISQGWDVTPDASKPSVSGSDIMLSVKDTHPSPTYLRNVVTWQVISLDQSYRKRQAYDNCAELVSKPGYCSDFARYEIHRNVYNNGILIPELSKTHTETDINTNIWVDSESVSYLNDEFKYYLVVVDDADTNFKYQNGTVINPAPSQKTEVNYANETDKFNWNGSIIPAIAHASISNVQLQDVGIATATISWDTDQGTDSLVEYRPKILNAQTGIWSTDPDNNHQFTAVGHRENLSTHSVTIFGLKPETVYEYRVISRNYPFANETVVKDGLPELKTNGFTITYLPNELESATVSATLHWATNMPSNNNSLEYRLSNDNEQNKGAKEPSIVFPKDTPENHKNCNYFPGLCSHSVTIGNLRGSSEYTFRILATSLDGFNTDSGILSFRTANSDTRQFTMAPASSNVADRDITATTAQIVFQTAIPTYATVHYGITKGGPYPNSATDGIFTQSHVIKLEGLSPGSAYYYYVEAKDINSLVYSSPETSFKAVLKPKISNMTVRDVTPYSITIAWETNVETETLINWGKTASYGEKRGVPGYSKAHVLKLENLEDNQEYHYQILAKDELGNEVADADKIIRTPLDTEGPKILNVKIDTLPLGDADSTASVIVTWETNKPATAQVQYDEGILGGRYSKSSIEDKSLNSTHTVIVKDLDVATTYHFRIVAKDKRQNTTISNDYTFMTPSKEKSILQLILKSLEETFSWIGRLGNFFRGIGKKAAG